MAYKNKKGVNPKPEPESKPKQKSEQKPLYRYQKEIDTIIKYIEPRIRDICSKFAKGIYNEATMFAFWIGIGGDLDEALTKIQKRKNRKNQQ